jgi:hypothetical protein
MMTTTAEAGPAVAAIQTMKGATQTAVWVSWCQKHFIKRAKYHNLHNGRLTNHIPVFLL